MTRPASSWLGAARTAFILATIFFISVIIPVSAHGGKRTWTVKHGQSIQKAIDKARPGDCIIVEKGNYTEQLTIKKDDIDLIGYGAILLPPKKPVKNTCTGLAPSLLLPDTITQAGICVEGYKVEFKPPPFSEHRRIAKVGRLVKGVSITGFDIQGFSGLNIAVVGGKDTKVYKNKLSSSPVYGSLTVGSKNTRIYGNIISADPNGFNFIGICMDDKSDVHVTKNKISGYVIGLCIQTNGADVSGNEVSKSCRGAFVDPGIVGAKVIDNYIHDGNPLCADPFPFVVAAGIYVSGGDDSFIKGNKITGQNTGIVVVDDYGDGTTPVAVAEGNKFIQNKLFKNDFDVFVNTTGTGNVFRRNKCTTSSLASICA